MSSHRVPKVTRNPFHPQRTARNGKVPSATEYRRRADSFNYIAGYQKKMWTVRAADLNNVVTPSSAATYAWNTYFHTGEATDAVWVYLGLVKTDFGYAIGSEPSWSATVKAFVGGATIDTVDHTFNQSATSATVTPDDIHHTRIKLSGLSANTAYRLENQVTNGARAVYMMVVEERKQVLSTATTGVSDPGSCRVEGDIDDANISKLITANNQLWRHNKAPILCWMGDYEFHTAGVGHPTITGNTAYTDIYTNRGFTLDTRYQTTLMRTSVPVVIAVLAARSGVGTGTLSVRLTDGTNHVAVTGIAAGGATVWTTATTTMPAALTTGWHLEAKQSDAVTTHHLYGVFVFPYET